MARFDKQDKKHNKEDGDGHIILEDNDDKNEDEDDNDEENQDEDDNYGSDDESSE